MPVNLDAIVAKTFDVLDAAVPDAVVPIDFFEAALSIYDPHSRTYQTGVCTHSGVPAVIAQPTADEIGGEVQYSTAKFVVPAERLPGVTPQTHDVLKTEDGQNYGVVRVKGVPGQSVWLIFAEQTA